MKTFRIEITGKFKSNKKIPEILKEPLQVLQIKADSKEEAIEKIKQKMLTTKYRGFFPILNNREDELWFCAWQVQHLFPEHIVYDDGVKEIDEWTEEEIIEMSESIIKEDIFERIQIVAK